MSSTTGMIFAFKARIGRNAEQRVQIVKTEYTVLADTKLYPMAMIRLRRIEKKP